jgi:hypothetical protein
MTPAVTFTRPFTLSSTANPVAGALGITTFQIPEARDFSLITNKSITTTALTFWVQVSDESAYYVLKMAYIVMFNNNYVYRMLSKCSSTDYYRVLLHHYGQKYRLSIGI